MKKVGAFAALLLLGMAVPSRAIVTMGSSDAFGVQANVGLLTLNLNVAIAPTVNGIAPNPYNDSDQVLSLNATAGALGSLSTGLLLGGASSNVDGVGGIRATSANAVVNNLLLNLVPGAFTPSLINLTATQVTSNSSVSGDYNSFTRVGSSVLTNTQLQVLGVPVSVISNPSPNTLVFDSLGIRIMLNEQLYSGDGIGSYGLATNAIHISLLNVLAGGGLINGDIVIAHSQAGMGAVPEPASLLVAGGGVLWLILRRRRAN